MVDLFCKVKLVEEVLELIKSMEIESNLVVWGVLLSGCKVCKNIEVVEIVVVKLMEMELENCGYYNLLVNMYVEVKRWKEVVEIRGKMREFGVEKRCFGCSWIEVEY